MIPLPSLFVSHGSPMLTLEPELPAHSFLAGAAPLWPRPRAILVVSPHWATARPTLGAGTWPETIHDFSGFPAALYRLRYPAPGAPDLAARVKALLDAAGLAAELDAGRGFDHGVWAPLRLSYPAADIPVVPLSTQPHRDPAYQLALGRALAPLREEGVLVYASGTMGHNLFEMDRSGRQPIAPWAREFAEWMAGKLAAREDAALLDYRRQAPFAERNHPTDDHLLPLFVALGAASPGVPARRLHASVAYGVQAMDCYRFD